MRQRKYFMSFDTIITHTELNLVWKIKAFDSNSSEGSLRGQDHLKPKSFPSGILPFGYGFLDF